MGFAKLLAALAGLVTGSLPPEALVILMEPPPGTGRLPPDVAAAEDRAQRSRARRATRHQHPVRRKTPRRRPG